MSYKISDKTSLNGTNSTLSYPYTKSETDKTLKNYSNKTILIMGQPRSGKTTVAKRMSELLGFPIVHTDRLLCEIMAKTPYYSNYTSSDMMPVIVSHLRKLKSNYDNVIIEGMSITPMVAHILSPDAMVFMTVNTTPKELLQRCRKYDAPTNWTCNQPDNSLLQLFTMYQEFSSNWETVARDRCIDIIDTAKDYEKGINEAIKSLMRQLNTHISK